jgi:membrane fusion protein (multidrug efflux system)
MKTKVIAAIGLVAVIVGVLAGVKAMQIRQLIASGAKRVQPPEAVSTLVASEQKWQGLLSAIGSVVAVQGVTVNPEIAGMVKEIAFESGAVVARGDLLVKLDTSSEEAQLRAVEAQEELARLNAERVRKLAAAKTVSQADLDAAEATLKQQLADADNIRATIAKKTIRAPFAGRLGIRQVNLGQFLDAGKPIVSLQSLSPIYVEFSLPQQDLAQLRTGMKVTLACDTYPGRKFEGSVTAINPDLDSSTRMVTVQATLENSDQALRPGMFARVDVLLPEEQNVVVVPQTAVLSAPYGDSVFVVEAGQAGTNGAPGLVVRQQFVRLGETRGDFIAVKTGLKAGEKVASAGVFKLRNKMAVVENNDVVPGTALAPRPSDS